MNREIEVTNQRLRQLKARITRLQNWLKEEAENTEPPALADVIQGILARREQTGKSDRYQAVGNLKAAAKMLSFLQQNQIRDMAGLDEKFRSMIDEQMNIREELKPVERRMTVLKKHIGQADTYLKYKSKKALTESEQILFTAANTYLKDVLNGRTALPLKAWKKEYVDLTDKRQILNQRYASLKDEVKEAEQIRKNVYTIFRQEQQSHKAKDMEL
nr:hypothetical protein [Sedimentibacter hydroxybenzoicus]